VYSLQTHLVTGQCTDAEAKFTDEGFQWRFQPSPKSNSHLRAPPNEVQVSITKETLNNDEANLFGGKP
jgi:hypothetical protein